MVRRITFAVLLIACGYLSFATAGPIWNTHNAEVQGLKIKNVLKKIANAFCEAAYGGDSNPKALAEAIRSWGEMNEAEMESVKDILKRFGSNLCDYITKDNGSIESLATQWLTSRSVFPRQNVWNLQSASQKLTDTETQGLGAGILNVFKKVGSALCRAAYDKNNPNALAEVLPSWNQMDEAEIENVRDFFKRFGSNLCNYVTEGNGPGGLSEQGFTAPWPKQELSKAEIEGFFKIARNVGSALCRAAYPGKNPMAIVQSLGITDEVEIQRLTNFLKRFGSNLCDYVTDGGEETTKQSRNNIIKWTTNIETSAEEQGFFRNIGSALCKTAYGGNQNPAAAAQLLGLTDEAEVQKFTDFLKRFGSNLCDYITDDSSQRVQNRPAQTEQYTLPISWSPRQWGSNGPIVQPVQLQWSNAKKQGIRDAAKKIGSALCRAAYSPNAAAESVVSQGLMDQAEAQKFVDFLKRFGANLCDYITEDNGKIEAIKQDLIQELMAAEE